MEGTLVPIEISKIREASGGYMMRQQRTCLQVSQVKRPALHPLGRTMRGGAQPWMVVWYRRTLARAAVCRVETQEKSKVGSGDLDFRDHGGPGAAVPMRSAHLESC